MSTEKQKAASREHYQKNIEKRRAYCRKYYAEHKQERQKYKESNKEKIKNQTLLRRYNITQEQHEQLYIDQRGCCASCGKPIEYKDVHTDHNHLTNSIRGLLCPTCNQGLGLFFIDEKGSELLSKAIEYVNKY